MRHHLANILNSSLTEMFVLCFWERLRNMSIYVINHLAWIGRWYSVILPLEELIKPQKIHVVQFPTCQNQHSSEWGVWMKVSRAITVSKTVELAMKKSARSPSFGKIWYGCPITQSLNNQGFSLLYLMCFYTNQGLIPFDSNKLLWELFKIPGWGESISTCQHAGEFCLLYLVIFTCFYTPCCILLHNWLKKKYVYVQQLFLMMIADIPLKCYMKRQNVQGFSCI